MTHRIAHQYLDLNSKLEKVSTLVGNTPLFRISNVFRKPGIEIYAKLEWQQLGGSVKSRPAFNIIKNAIIDGHLDSQKQLLDATSGNTGIAYASIGAALGIPVTLCLPENASEERKRILKALGANIIYTSRFESTDGAQLKAKELVKEFPNKYFYADQYANHHNWKAHFDTTGVEIWNQTKGRITHFVAGLGTTGTFMGTTRRLKKYNTEIQTIALQPDNPMHSLEGWKHLETAIVPKIYDAKLADRFLEIDTLEAFDLVKKVAQKEGLLISPSAAANLLGAIKIAKEIDRGVIVTTFADNAEKYTEVMKQIFNS
jgi:S-sulfo-L-cysteine synthase (O-acetyl-L-serine-dependent)